MDLYVESAKFKRRPLIDNLVKITDGANEISELNSGQEAFTAEREGRRAGPDSEVPSSARVLSSDRDWSTRFCRLRYVLQVRKLSWTHVLLSTHGTNRV